MNDRPNAGELVAAGRHFLESELLPSISDSRLRFLTLVTANVLAIVERELVTQESHRVSELAGLKKWFGELESNPCSFQDQTQKIYHANQQLCERIRQGEFDAPDKMTQLANDLRDIVVKKLQVANPRYLAGFQP